MSNLTDRQIYELAKAGAQLAKVLDGGSRVRRDYRVPKSRLIVQLENLFLAVWEKVADLDQYGLASDSLKRLRTVRDWEIEIRARIGKPDPEIEGLDDTEYRILREGGWALREVPGQGWWVRRTNGEGKFYCQRSSAVRYADGHPR